MPRPTREELAVAPTYRTILMQGGGDDPFGLAGLEALAADEDADPAADAPAAEAGVEPPLSEVFRAVRDGDVMWTSQGERLPVDDFKAQAVRCAPDGSPIVPMQAPLHLHQYALKQFARKTPDADIEAHFEDVRALRAAMPQNPEEIEDLGMRAQAHLTDAFFNDARDHVVRQEDLPEQPPERGPDPVIAIIQRDTGIGTGNWKHVADFPTYQVEQIRVMARAMLAPVLGNVAQLEDLRLLMIPKDEHERGASIRRWIRGTEDSRTLEPFSHAHMPGYRTDEPILAERDGVTMLTFSDFMATYAYVWQTDPEMRLDMPPPPADDFDEPEGFRY